MADMKPPVNTASSKRHSYRTSHFSHLKPLSVYSHRVFCKDVSSCSVSPDTPPLSLRVEFSNRGVAAGHKRHLDDSCLTHDYDAPAKKTCLDQRLSPDSARRSHLRQVKLVSQHSPFVGLAAIERIDKTLSEQTSLGLGWSGCTSKNNVRSSESLPAVRPSSPVILHNDGSAGAVPFDYDVDEVMCLSPIDSTGSLEDLIRSHQTSQEQLLAEDPCSPGTAQTESDEGYFTKSFIRADLKDVTESEMTKSDQLSFIKSYKVTVPNSSNDQKPVSVPVASTPSDKFKQVPALRPKLNLKTESWSSSALCRSACENLYADEPKAPFLHSQKSKGGNVSHEETLMSSARLIQAKHFACQVDGADAASVGRQQAAVEVTVTFREKTDAGDNVENKPPLQIQVDSAMVLSNTHKREAVKAQDHRHPLKEAAPKDQRSIIEGVPRPVVLYSEKDWEKEKTAYVDSVARHISDNGTDGVMTELLHLMNTVANQGKGSDGRKWEHPSDLTRRNYRLRNSGRLLSLEEWQNLNYRYHRRFAKVPQVFERRSVL